MVIGRPQLASPARIARMTSACSAWVPCEKLSRATSMPAATSRSSISGRLVAGPIVQTIFVRLNRLLLQALQLRGPRNGPRTPPVADNRRRESSGG